MWSDRVVVTVSGDRTGSRGSVVVGDWSTRTTVSSPVPSRREVGDGQRREGRSRAGRPPVPTLAVTRPPGGPRRTLATRPPSYLLPVSHSLRSHSSRGRRPG